MAISVRQFGSVDGAKKNLNPSNITVAPFEKGSVIYTRSGYNAAHVSKKLSLTVPRPKKALCLYFDARPRNSSKKASYQMNACALKPAHPSRWALLLFNSPISSPLRAKRDNQALPKSFPLALSANHLSVSQCHALPTLALNHQHQIYNP